jgi:hypothetical protein
MMVNKKQNAKKISKQKIQNTNPKKKTLNPITYLLIKKFNVQMLLYTLTKRFIEVHVKCIWYHIVLQNGVWWFDGQDIGMELKTPKLNPPYQHIFCGVYIIIIYIFCTCV